MNKKVFHKNRLINNRNYILENSNGPLIIHKEHNIKQTEKNFNNNSVLEKKKH